MKTTDSSGDRQTFWTASVTPSRFARLDCDTDADVCAVGGGIVGLTTAYLLMKDGKSVVLLEDGEIGSCANALPGRPGRCSLADARKDAQRVVW